MHEYVRHIQHLEERYEEASVSREPNLFSKAGNPTCLVKQGTQLVLRISFMSRGCRQLISRVCGRLPSCVISILALLCYKILALLCHKILALLCHKILALLCYKYPCPLVL